MIVFNLVLALFLTFWNPTENESKPKIEVFACDAKAYKDKCVEEIPEGYTFLKSYTLDGQNGARRKIQNSYIFSKNTQYLLLINNGGANKVNGLKVTIYDSNRRKIAESYANNRFYSGVGYKCNVTGIYHFEFEYVERSNFCGAGVLTFKR